MEGGEGDDEIVGYEDRDINTGGAGDDTFGFFLGSFAPSSTLATSDRVTDFEGAGAAGGSGRPRWSRPRSRWSVHT